MAGVMELANRVFYGEQRRAGIERVVAQQNHFSVAGVFTPFPMDTTRVWGVDVDQYSGVVDFQKMKAAGVKFVIIKAMDGTLTSKYFAQNWAAAKAAGIPRAAYCWLYASQNISGTAQANAWWKVLKDDPGELPIFVDFEWTFWLGRPSNPYAKDLYGVIEAFKTVSGGRVLGVYTAPGYWAEYGSTDNYYAGIILWLANYNQNPSLTLVPFIETAFLQCTPSADAQLVGIDPAMEKAVDGDYYLRNYDDFLQRFGLAAKQPPAQPPSTPATILTDYQRGWNDGLTNLQNLAENQKWKSN